MQQGISRFEFQLNKIEALLQQAAMQDNPALWLFEHDMRTPVFMLEALSRLYANWRNKKTFIQFKDTFKSLEDMLGAIDYYTAFAKEFSTNDKIPASVKTIIEKKKEKQIQILNKALKEDNWLEGKRLKKIKAKLKEADWLNEAEETQLLKPFYQKEIQKIEKFAQEAHFVFENIETGVHELRRRLRWLSIYPQALQGAIKLEKTSPVAKHLEKYLMPEVISSPFNKFPISAMQSHFLILEESHFYALSWLISKLGKIKDNGLRIKIIQEALKEATLLNDESSLGTTYKILGNDYPTIPKLLGEANTIVKQYFEENNLAHIIL